MEKTRRVLNFESQTEHILDIMSYFWIVQYSVNLKSRIIESEVGKTRYGTMQGNLG